MNFSLRTLFLALFLVSISFSLSSQKTLLPKQHNVLGQGQEWCYENLNDITKPIVSVSYNDFKGFVSSSLEQMGLRSYSDDIGNFLPPEFVVGQNGRYGGKYLFSDNRWYEIEKLLSGFCFFPILERVAPRRVKTIGWRVVIAYQDVDRFTVSNQVSLLEFNSIDELISSSFEQEIIGKNELNLLFSNTATVIPYTAEQLGFLQNSMEFDFVFLPYNDYIDIIQSGETLVIERSRITYDTTVANDIAFRIPSINRPVGWNDSDDQCAPWHFRSLAFRPDPTPSLTGANGRDFGTAAYAYVDGRRCPPYWWDDDFNSGRQANASNTEDPLLPCDDDSGSSDDAGGSDNGDNGDNGSNGDNGDNGSNSGLLNNGNNTNIFEITSNFNGANIINDFDTNESVSNFKNTPDLSAYKSYTRPSTINSTPDAENKVDSLNNDSYLIQSTLNHYAITANIDASIVAISYNRKHLLWLSKVNAAIGYARPARGPLDGSKPNIFFELGAQAHFRSIDIYLTLGRYNIPGSRAVNSINISPIRPAIFRSPAISTFLIGDLALNWPDTEGLSIGYRTGLFAEINFPGNQDQNTFIRRLKAILGIQYQDFSFNNNLLPNMIGVKAGLSYSFSTFQ